MKDEFTLDEVIEMAKTYASEQFIEVLNDYNKEIEFFESHQYTITVEKD